MAAHMLDQGVSKHLILKLVLANLFVFILLASVVYLPLNSGSAFDLISNVLHVCLGFCGLIAVFHVLLWLSLTESKQLKFQPILHGGIVFGFFCVLFHIIAVLYGAPFAQATAETFHFALVLTTTSVFPACIFLGSQVNNWIRVFVQNSPEVGVESVIHITSLLSILGALLGAVPIPLDWDRPWQIWPISCVLGTMIGYLSGLLVSSVQLFYHYRQLCKMKLT